MAQNSKQTALNLSEKMASASKKKARESTATQEINRLEGLSLKQLGEETVKFGKFAGQTCHQVFQEKTDYLKWLIEHHENKPKYLNVIWHAKRQALMAEMDSLPPTPGAAAQSSPGTTVSSGPTLASYSPAGSDVRELGRRGTQDADGFWRAADARQREQSRLRGGADSTGSGKKSCSQRAGTDTDPASGVCRTPGADGSTQRASRPPRADQPGVSRDALPVPRPDHVSAGASGGRTSAPGHHRDRAEPRESGIGAAPRHRELVGFVGLLGLMIFMMMMVLVMFWKLFLKKMLVIC